MAGGNLNNHRVEALGHAPLQGGLDGAVVRCDKIATSLAAPCRRGHRSTQRSTCCWRLGGVEDQLFRVGQILRKGVAYARLRELKIPLCVRADFRTQRCRLDARTERSCRLTRVRGEGRDIHEPLALPVVSAPPDPPPPPARACPA